MINIDGRGGRAGAGCSVARSSVRVRVTRLARRAPVNAVNRLTLATHCLVGISSLVGLLFTCKTTRVILTSTTDDISANRYNIY